MNDRIARRYHRARSALLCRLGRHWWVGRRNPDIGGRGALYDECRRCGTVRMGWHEPGPGPVT